MSLPKMLIEPEDVEAELRRLGIPLRVLTMALERGEAGYNSRTSNHPKTAPGLQRWMDTTCALRDYLMPLGWTKDDPENQPLTVSPDEKLVILAASGDENTGLDSFEQPKTKSCKGPRTVAAVQRNARQMDMFAAHLPVPKLQLGKQTWLLLTYRDQHELRAELSLATNITGKGRVDGWHTRILLPSLSTDPGADIAFNRNTGGPEIVVPVKRRA